MQLDKLIGISPEKLLLERSRVVRKETKKDMSDGRGPESSLLERSNPVRLVQFLMPRGNWPLSPMSLILIEVPAFDPSKFADENFDIVIEVP